MSRYQIDSAIQTTEVECFLLVPVLADVRFSILFVLQSKTSNLKGLGWAAFDTDYVTGTVSFQFLYQY